MLSAPVGALDRSRRCVIGKTRPGFGYADPPRPEGGTDPAVAAVPWLLPEEPRQCFLIPAEYFIAAESRRRSRPGGGLSPHPRAACGHGPRRRRPGQGRPKAGPKDREAPLTRTAPPRYRPPGGGVGRSADGCRVPAAAPKARPFPPCELSRRSRTAYRVCRSGLRFCLGCWCLLLSVVLVAWVRWSLLPVLLVLLILAPRWCWYC